MILPQDPIFIVGYPRSGTTLLQRLLCAQPGIFSFPETHYFCVVEKQMKVDENENILPSCMDKVFEKVHEKMGFQFTREESIELSGLAQEKNLTSRKFFEYIVCRFLIDLHPIVERISSFRWIEKTPNHALFIDRIIEFYPKAKALHIIRHPAPAVFSRKLKFPFNRETPLSELADRWNRMLEKVEHFIELFPGYIHTLRYEDLVGDINKEMTSASDFLQIPFDTNLISSTEQDRISSAMILPSEPWKWEDVNREMANTNDVYKNRITREDAAVIEEITLKNMKRYGYMSYFQ
jgi:hypothetical protein